jgi:hypothetical protein
MLTTAPVTSADLAAALLVHYSFDLSGYNTSELIDRWEAEYPLHWLHLAVIEALYQGRYKAVSVQQLLNFWQRRGQVIYHFNTEFERLICSKFPECLSTLATPVLASAQKHTTIEQLTNSHLSSAKVEMSYQQRQTAPRQLASSEVENQRRNRDEASVLTSPSFKVAETPTRQLAAAVSQRVVFLETPPVTSELPQTLQPAANNPPIGQFTPQRSDRSESLTSKLKMLQPVANNSPIGQFTPEKCDRSESFTSKLKAMSIEEG